MTGLPGQRSFIDFLERASNRLGGYRERFCLLLIDLDDFHDVNIALGHESGCELLIQMGERLRGCVTPGDFVARLEDDRFAVLQTGRGDRTAADALAAQIQRAFVAPFVLDGVPISMTLNIGVALAPMDGAQPTTLIEIASAGLAYGRVDRNKPDHFGNPPIELIVARRTRSGARSRNGYGQ